MKIALNGNIPKKFINEKEKNELRKNERWWKDDGCGGGGVKGRSQCSRRVIYTSITEKRIVQYFMKVLFDDGGSSEDDNN